MADRSDVRARLEAEVQALQRARPVSRVPPKSQAPKGRRGSHSPYTHHCRVIRWTPPSHPTHAECVDCGAEWELVASGNDDEFRKSWRWNRNPRIYQPKQNWQNNNRKAGRKKK